MERAEVLEAMRRIEYCVPDRFDPREKERDLLCPLCRGKVSHNKKCAMPVLQQLIERGESK